MEVQGQWSLNFVGVDRAQAEALFETLKAQGFEQQTTMASEEAVITTLVSDDYLISFLWADDGEGTLSYSVIATLE